MAEVGQGTCSSDKCATPTLPGSSQARTTTENGIEVVIKSNHATPGKTSTFFNPKMRMNREMVLCALSSFITEKEKPVECLDAFGGTGISGLQWIKHCEGAVQVTISDVCKESTQLIQENCQRNGISVQGEKDEQTNNCTNSVKVVNCDANVLLHQQAFDFVYLDPYGTSVQYLEAAFRNVRNQGIIAVSSTDTSTLFGKSENVAARNYGGYLIRTEYYRELGTRMVLQAVARAAARCYKGIEVLLSAAVEHCILVIVRVHRGGKHADNSVGQINKLLHCRLCEERVYHPSMSSVLESNYTLLKCDCHKNIPGVTAVELGPIWSGSIFNAKFITNMQEAGKKISVSKQVEELLDIMLSEAICSDKKKPLAIRCSIADREESGDYCDNRTGDGWGGESEKRPLEDTSGDGHVEKRARFMSDSGGGDKSNAAEIEFDGQPSFYYDLHKHSQKDMNTPKTNRMVAFLHDSGYRASRTHFNHLAVRTNASRQQFVEVLRSRGSKTLKL
ncbi:tRNA (guanine(27)-N(2))-dimethyltransferase-like [Glandiceps talaboti]